MGSCECSRGESGGALSHEDDVSHADPDVKEGPNHGPKRLVHQQQPDGVRRVHLNLAEVADHHSALAHELLGLELVLELVLVFGFGLGLGLSALAHELRVGGGARVDGKARRSGIGALGG